jgi:hypothetical protein
MGRLTSTFGFHTTVYGADEFRWNLHPNEKFSVGLLYKVIIQSDISVNNNKKIWKMKISLKAKNFG